MTDDPTLSELCRGTTQPDDANDSDSEEVARPYIDRQADDYGYIDPNLDENSDEL